MTITTFFSCKKLFKNVLKVEVENKTNITKNIQLHTTNSSDKRQDSISFMINPKENETFKWKDAQLSGDGYVSLTINDTLQQKPLVGYVTNGYVDGEVQLTIFSEDSILIQ